MKTDQEIAFNAGRVEGLVFGYMAATEDMREIATKLGVEFTPPILPADFKLNGKEVPIKHLGLDIRVHNVLRREGIETLSELAAYSEQDLRLFRGFSKLSVDEIKRKLADLGFILPSVRKEVLVKELIAQVWPDNTN